MMLKLQKADSNLVNLQFKLTNCLKDKETQTYELDIIKEALKSSEKRTTSLNKMLEISQSENNTSSKTIRDQLDRYSNLEKKLNEKIEELDQYKLKNQTLQLEINVLAHQKDEAIIKSAQLGQINSDLEQRLMANECSLKSELDQKSVRIREIELELHNCELSNEKLKKIFNDQCSDYDEFKISNLDLTKKYNEAHMKYIDSIGELNDSQLAHRNELIQMRKENAKLELDLNELNNRYKILESNKERLEYELTERDLKIKRLEPEQAVNTSDDFKEDIIIEISPRKNFSSSFQSSSLDLNLSTKRNYYLIGNFFLLYGYTPY